MAPGVLGASRALGMGLSNQGNFRLYYSEQDWYCLGEWWSLVLWWSLDRALNVEAELVHECDQAANLREVAEVAPRISGDRRSV